MTPDEVYASLPEVVYEWLRAFGPMSISQLARVITGNPTPTFEMAEALAVLESDGEATTAPCSCGCRLPKWWIPERLTEWEAALNPEEVPDGETPTDH